MEKAHWFRTKKDTLLAFTPDEFLYLRANAATWRDEILKLAETGTLRQISEGTYDYLQSVCPGLANKIIGLTLGAWIEDVRKAKTNIYKYILYNYNSADDIFYWDRLHNYDKRTGSSRIIIVSNGLNADESLVAKEHWGYAQFSAYMVLNLIVPFLEFATQYNYYSTFVEELYESFLDSVPGIYLAFNDKTIAAKENNLDVQLDENWNKRYLAILNDEED